MCSLSRSDLIKKAHLKCLNWFTTIQKGQPAGNIPREKRTQYPIKSREETEIEEDEYSDSMTQYQLIRRQSHFTLHMPVHHHGCLTSETPVWRLWETNHTELIISSFHWLYKESEYSKMFCSNLEIWEIVSIYPKYLKICGVVVFFVHKEKMCVWLDHNV